MRHRQWSDQCLTEFERAVNYVRLRLQIIWNWIAGVECEPKHALQILHRFGRRIDRHRASRVRKSPEIVKAHDVISVGVRENYRIDFPNILAQRLCPEISPSVHHKRALWSFHIDRGAKPLVTRIRRAADIAIAANHRHSLRSSGPEKGDRKP